MAERGPVRRGHPDQRFEADKAALRYFKEGLIMQFEAIILYRLADRLSSSMRARVLGIHLGHEKPDAVAAGGLGRVECEACRHS